MENGTQSVQIETGKATQNVQQPDKYRLSLKTQYLHTEISLLCWY